MIRHAMPAEGHYGFDTGGIPLYVEYGNEARRPQAPRIEELRDQSHCGRGSYRRGSRRGRGYDRRRKDQNNENHGRRREEKRHNNETREYINFYDDDELFGYLQCIEHYEHPEQHLRDTGRSFIALMGRITSFDEDRRNKCLSHISKIYSHDSVIHDPVLTRKTYNFEILFSRGDSFIQMLTEITLKNVFRNALSQANNACLIIRSILYANPAFYYNIAHYFNVVDILRSRSTEIEGLCKLKEEI